MVSMVSMVSMVVAPCRYRALVRPTPRPSDTPPYHVGGACWWALSDGDFVGGVRGRSMVMRGDGSRCMVCVQPGVLRCAGDGWGPALAWLGW
jgi:hypothetical protein